jgi:hypothetical protein
VRHKRTPIRFIEGQVLAWLKSRGKDYFSLGKPTSKSIILHEPWGKVHVTHMCSPGECKCL